MTGRTKAGGSPAPRVPKHPRQPPRVDRLVGKIQGALSLDLLHPSYRSSDPDRLYHACLGHCYAATEALYYLYGREAGFVPHMFKHQDGTTHWWLAHPETGQVIDPTEPQLDGEPFDYSRGRRHSFLTGKPSRRAAEIIRRVQAAARR